jgi:hypothetical protein
MLMYVPISSCVRMCSLHSSVRVQGIPRGRTHLCALRIESGHERSLPERKSESCATLRAWWAGSARTRILNRMRDRRLKMCPWYIQWCMHWLEDSRAATRTAEDIVIGIHKPLQDPYTSPAVHEGRAVSVRSTVGLRIIAGITWGLVRVADGRAARDAAAHAPRCLRGDELGVATSARAKLHPSKLGELSSNVLLPLNNNSTLKITSFGRLKS